MFLTTVHINCCSFYYSIDAEQILLNALVYNGRWPECGRNYKVTLMGNLFQSPSVHNMRHYSSFKLYQDVLFPRPHVTFVHKQNI